MSIYHASVKLNDGQPAFDVTLTTPKDLILRVGRDAAKLELEQLQTLILTLRAAEVQMHSWTPGSPRWP